MDCYRCGKRIAEDSLYCKFCGARQGKTVTDEFTVEAGDLLKRIQELLHEGNVTRIIVKDEAGKLLLEIPATAAVVGAILVPWMAAIGVIAALATRCRIVVEKRA